ncbi:hypothetical protein KI387_010083, partial [Taxus chinensis]
MQRDFVAESGEYRNKPRFLYGESMGGAVVLLLHRKEASFWNGAVLVAPMCKVPIIQIPLLYLSQIKDKASSHLDLVVVLQQISDKIKPHAVVANILTWLELFIPKWKIVPTKDVIDSAFKDPAKREQIRSNELIYQDKPRLKTALEMMRTSMDLENRLCEVTVPFLVLHGEDDSVTDPCVSSLLYNSACSHDKELKIYPGMWHALTSGEPDHNVDRVFTDILSWLDHRVNNQIGSGKDGPLSEYRQKKPTKFLYSS